jgi:general secretion pathway protein D
MLYIVTRKLTAGIVALLALLLFQGTISLAQTVDGKPVSPPTTPLAPPSAAPAAPGVSPQPPQPPPAAAQAQPAVPQADPGAATGASTGRAIEVDEEKFVGLNFDYADINIVIQTLADLIGLNYILAPGISGKVTIQTSGKIAMSDLFFILEKILEVNNLAAVKSGDFYKIMPVGTARQDVLETFGPDEEAFPEDRMIIKIFKLKHAAPSEIVRLLNPLKSSKGVFIPHDPTGILFVVDTAARTRMFQELIDSVDVDIYNRIQVELYPVKNAKAEDLAKDLTQVLASVTAIQGRAKARFKLIPVTAINALLFVTSDPSLSTLMAGWVAELDQPAGLEEEKIFVYGLQHANAENLATILRELYAEDTAVERTTARTTSDTPRLRTRQETPRAATVVQATAVVGKVKIVADKDTNSLIIQTAPWNYPPILETIKKLDKVPRQVLIEVTIAELTLDDEDDLGIEWAIRSQGTATVGGETHGYTSVAQSIFNESGAPAAVVPGFSYLIAEANRVTAVLNAYAKASRLNILSHPHILASDNKEAKIDVGEEVPIITTETQSAEGLQVDRTIEYRSTGIILTVTPHINENKYVTLDVTQEVSEAQTNLLGGTDSPIIRKRFAQTSMVVKDNQTLIIGGLMEEERERSREGIPFLSRLPVLGYLFGVTTDTLSKTELLILITPRVVTTVEEGESLTEEYINKAITLKRSMETGKTYVRDPASEATIQELRRQREERILEEERERESDR